MSKNGELSNKSLSKDSSNNMVTEQMVLLIMKIKNKPEYQQSKVIFSCRVQKAMDLVTKWADSGEISSIIEFHSNKRREYFNEASNWVYEPSIIRVKVKKW